MFFHSFLKFGFRGGGALEWGFERGWGRVGEGLLC